MPRLTKQQRYIIKIKEYRKAGLSVTEIAQKMHTYPSKILKQICIYEPGFMQCDNIMPTVESETENDRLMDILNMTDEVG